MSLREAVIKELLNVMREDLKEICESKAYRNTTLVILNPSKVCDLTRIMKEKFDARLSHEFALEDELGFRVYYVYDLSFMERHLHLIAMTRISRGETIPSIAPVTEEALWAEREYAELLGISYVNHPDGEKLRHQFLPHEWPDVPEKGSWVTTPRPYGAYSILPFGPYHPALLEATYFRVLAEGEMVLDIDIKTGFNHRGIMKLAEKRDYHKALHLCTRVCGICNAAHAQTYVNAVENLLGIEVPERAKYIRVLADELNRIHSHLLYFGVESYLAGFETLFMLSFRYREEVMDAIELLSGNRVLMDIHDIGGVRRDVSDEALTKIRGRLRSLREAVEKFIGMLQEHRVLRARMEDIGVLRAVDAKRAGAVGPTARGSGWRIDVRHDSPCEVYDEVSWEVITDEGKDVLSRTMVRLREVLVSIGICEQCLEALQRVKGPVKLEDMPSPEAGAEGMGLYEAPRGELFYYVVSDGSPNPYAVRIRTPSYRNMYVLKYMVPGYELADVPVIIGSIDPCLACTDRIQVIDVKRGEIRYYSIRELKRHNRIT
ncbi:MAG: nickel-dependent hydrogenase large subunit [Thermoprotei archaeon]|nr:nickel-dependent hydrogenase large subunit [Thermoprotei archaeon]